jgi:hypothetical protein
MSSTWVVEDVGDQGSDASDASALVLDIGTGNPLA